ncbi:MAG: ammonium transporter [Thermoplasmata archaeon]|nr:ammonium transporter [Thermoplasmata archaeon]MCI4355288.1 ammonium transporter [Thermoplasmata archaeon]
MALDSGDIAWVITATALVMIMTPALGFFYGGLVRRKNLIATIVQCLAIFSVVSLVWALWGYTMTFGPSVDGVIGNFSHLALWNVGAAPNPAYSNTIPELLYFAFQLKFAAITPALIIGAFAGRVRLKGLLIFIILWTTFIYVPIAMWIWNPGGFLHQLGVVDFAGGLVVHTSAGVSAVAAALVIGRRKDEEVRENRPNNVPYVILGTALLWFGWFGFNAGSALAADAVAVNALVVTNLAAAASGVSWLMVDWIRRGKPSAVGMAVGAVCGLAAVTPASGYVGPSASIVIGLVAGVLCNLIASWRARTTLDDSLDVFACHGAGGMWGTLAAGLFASTAINAAGPNGLFFGNPAQAGIELIGIAVVASFAFVGSYVLLRAIDIFSPLRVPPQSEHDGLDLSEFGEEAYEPDAPGAASRGTAG